MSGGAPPQIAQGNFLVYRVTVRIAVSFRATGPRDEAPELSTFVPLAEAFVRTGENRYDIT